MHSRGGLHHFLRRDHTEYSLWRDPYGFLTSIGFQLRERFGKGIFPSSVALADCLELLRSSLRLEQARLMRAGECNEALDLLFATSRLGGDGVYRALGEVCEAVAERGGLDALVRECG